MTTASSMQKTARRKVRQVGSLAKNQLVRATRRFNTSLAESESAEKVQLASAITDFPANPQLSVIVPAYNVAKYLEECVESIAAQSYMNWEMLIINDGSQDKTGSIADRVAAVDGRIRVVHQENQGLGAARNTGIKKSRAPYMTFIDSDDLVAPQAFRLMMESAEESGSDVVIGSIDRFNSTRHWVPFWVDLVHDERRIGITAKELPAVMWDVFACNKIFKRTTWNDNVGEFPTGTLYEDQECTAKLFVNDATLDILPETVYHWRHREDGQSITQQKSNIDDLAQRIHVAERVESIVHNYTTTYVEYWYKKCLGEDLFYYYREVPRTGPEFFEVLSRGVREFYDVAPREAIASIDPPRRWLAYLAAYGTREDMLELLTAFDTYRTYYTAVYEEGEIRAHVPQLERLFNSIPNDLRLVKPEHLKPQVVLTAVDSDYNGALTIEGFGYIPNLNFDLSYAVEMQNEQFSLFADSVVIDEDSPGAYTADPYNPHSRSKFRATFTSDLINRSFACVGQTEGNELDLIVSLSAKEHSWEVKNPKRSAEGIGGWPAPTEMTTGGHRFVVVGDSSTGTTLKMLTPRFKVLALRFSDGSIRIDAEQCTYNRLPNHARFGLENACVRIKSGSEVLTSGLVHGDASGFYATLSTKDLNVPHQSQFSQSLNVDIICDGKFAAPLAVSQQLIDNLEPQGLVAVTSSGFGYLGMKLSSVSTLVESVVCDHESNEIVFSGRHFVAKDEIRTYVPSLALVSADDTIKCTDLRWHQGTGSYVARFRLVDRGGEILRPGRFILQSLMPTKQNKPATLWVGTSSELERQLPKDLTSRAHNLRLTAVGKSRALEITLTGPGKTKDSESAFQVRSRSLAHFSDPDRAVEPGTVFFESFSGDSVTDSPKEIDKVSATHFPELKRFWSVRDLSIDVPEGAVPLVAGTDEWMYRLATSSVIVNNNNFPHYFRKAKAQKYIQTWHGTPLKKIGNDVPGASLSLRYRTLMTKEAETEWDLMLAQSSWAAETLSSAFAFDGLVFDAGYPRNDALADKSRMVKSRSSVREMYRIGERQTVILYAPTWRDDLKDSSGRYSRIDFLGMDNTIKSLGSDYIIFYRGHANSAHSRQGPLPSGVIDVTGHSDVNELMAAADLMITDYSSIMFDFVVTGKPISFVVPDLGRYRDDTRGFYFDFERESPGPLFSNGEQAVPWIKSAAEGAITNSEKYLNFVGRFAPSDDGRSAERFMDEYANLFGIGSLRKEV
ncbi:CDP-glycerol glycerophosphotransferase, TagB/SpsB family [Brevibacterium sandarakinum]|uniref:CDP-glycerol glycerophosphotransferase, TagB/SpsB family n=1 Tax=Brevibacterium sandarakinum TaxID=629680 RepID=A0A1H1PRB4_BRESA|nr:CDP-glycerol glycerophosphotransferase family protein [Brevibacterium sandarakinum]SDS13690.1 CDP-glycerol glycerophosphotransferase, TagB/SpsB family [Brevibacterium sandarakinum]